MNMRLKTHGSAGRAWLALAFLSLVICSCSTDDGLAPVVSPEPLTFSVRADGYGSATRGTPMNSVSGTVGLIGFEFTDDWSEDDRKTYLMYNEVMQGSGETWKTSKSFIPDASKKKRFYAYYPYQTNVDTEGGTMFFNGGSKDANAIIPYFDYTSPRTAADQKDLMYAVSADVEVDTEGKLQPIDLQFHHLLAALKITINNGFDNGTIKKVSISQIHDQCRFQYETQSWDPDMLDDNTVTMQQDVEVAVSTKNTDVLPLTSETQYFMLIPQALEQSSVLTVVFSNGNEDHTLTYALGKLKIDVPDGNGGTEQRGLVFEPGKLTRLNITVESITKMTVNCTLDDWDNGAIFGGENADQQFIDLDMDPDDNIGDWDGTPADKDITTGPGGNYID